jgi:glutathione S-transferase
MDLYGTRTSPFVRRIRVVAEMVGAPIKLVDSSTDEGQKQLRAISPIWKVPVLHSEEQVIFDSRVITDYLILQFGNRNIRTESGQDPWREINVLSVIDGALDASINVFYLAKDGAADLSYMRKQASRVESAMSWLESQLDAHYLTDISRIGRSEIALFTTLEWMTFRSTYPIERHPRLTQFVEFHRAFPPFASSRPGE